MTAFAVNYATPSVFESTRDRALLGLAADVGRPLAFHAKVVRDVLAIRFALQALGQVIWHRDPWRSEGDFFRALDPVVTVHPDRVFFEAFSADQGAYGLVAFDRALFEPVGEVRCGTTNVDFTAWLWAALAELRSSRETFLRVGVEGIEWATEGAGGRFEEKVDVPRAWLRGFLQLQGGMALPGTRLSVRPVDLLAALRFLRFTKAKVSPRALRYELVPGEDAALVLEPWERTFRLRGADHGHVERRVVRTWGRRRLSLLEPLLPFADRVDVYLKGRAMPSFYAAKLGLVTFVLGLSGWSSQRWTDGASFDLLVAPGPSGRGKADVLALLAERHVARVAEVANALSIERGTAARWLTALVAEGRALGDLETRAYRHRELFSTPVELGVLYPPDRRRERADELVRTGAVELTSATTRETTKVRRFRSPDGPVFRETIFRDWVVRGRVADQAEVELVLDDEDRLIFGRCGCTFFRERILAEGPCEHLRALLVVAQPRRVDAASARPIGRDEYEGARALGAARMTGPARTRGGGGGDAGEQTLDEGEGADDDA